MTKTEAIAAMRSGKKVRHRDFSEDEWMTMEGFDIVLEDGVRCDDFEFWRWRKGEGWEDGYSLVEENVVEEKPTVDAYIRRKEVIVQYAPISERYWNMGEKALIINNKIRLGGCWFDFDKRYYVIVDVN